MTWLLEMKNITKTFGAVKAVDNVSLRLNAGEVVSLCGENGSGKSTLMKVLCGIYPHGSYEGEIIFAGETLQANHIRDTERKGIAIIHQELALVKHLTVLENIFLGAEISRHGLLDYETRNCWRRSICPFRPIPASATSALVSSSWWRSPRR